MTRADGDKSGSGRRFRKPKPSARNPCRASEAPLHRMTNPLWNSHPSGFKIGLGVVEQVAQVGGEFVHRLGAKVQPKVLEEFTASAGSFRQPPGIYQVQVLVELQGEIPKGLGGGHGFYSRHRKAHSQDHSPPRRHQGTTARSQALTTRRFAHNGGSRADVFCRPGQRLPFKSFQFARRRQPAKMSSCQATGGRAGIATGRDLRHLGGGTRRRAWD